MKKILKSALIALALITSIANIHGQKDKDTFELSVEENGGGHG